LSRERAQEWLCKSIGINFPYVSMGKVDSLDLFGPNELMIFAFYAHNKDRYKRVLDIGANLGLHSMLMQRLGWAVKAFEPDPEVFARALENIWGDGHSTVHILCNAVSDHEGQAEFVRVLNNLTGSHIAGSKDSYGPRETFSVPVVDCRPLFDWADLAKLDVEGHEGVLLRCVTAAHLEHLDLICELRGAREAEQVLEHFNALDCPIYTQKNDWKPAIRFADMPTKHQEGSIFISKRGGPWTTHQ
jgi:FkbM family methyltransferase